MFQHHDEYIDDQMILIQANLDDLNPEMLPYVMDRLFEAGANDVYGIPIFTKKGRQGMMLNCLIAKELLEQAEDIIFNETTTLGVRYTMVTCHRLGRDLETVHTPWGPIRIKTGYYKGKVVQVAPEYEDCAKAAKAHHVPLKAVFDYARKATME